jgi:uncharacterized membrane protein YgcG
MWQGVQVRLLCVLIAAVASNVILRAEPLRQISTHGYISDFANVLDPGSAESLDELCYRLEHWTGTPLDAITVPSLGGGSSREYALRVFNEQSEFPESANRRIVILFGAKERKFTIIAAPEVQAILSGKVRQYRREVVPYLRRHQDGAALAHMTRRIAEDVALDAQVGLKEVNDDIPLGEWAPVAQPYDVFTRSLRVMIVLWSLVIVARFLVKRLRGRRPAKPALTFVVIENEPLKNLTT